MSTRNAENFDVHRIRNRSLPAHLALPLLVLSVAVFGTAAALAEMLVHLGGHSTRTSQLHFPAAFGISTLLLAAGSAALHASLRFVRTQRLPRLRRCLVAGVCIGTLFTGIQSYGIWCLLQDQIPAQAATSVHTFVFVFAALHGMHFIVAMLFLMFVTLRAFAGFYDHERYLGVLVCAVFWHILGIVWLCILCIFAIASFA